MRHSIGCLLLRGSAAAFALWLAGATDLWGARLRLDGERLSLQADNEPLSEVLEDFVRAGVDVRIEPGLDAVVDGALIDEDIDAAVEQLLGPFNYLLFWEVLQGPAGPLPRLSGIHVFRPGRMAFAAPFRPEAARASVVRPPGGAPFLADEVLLGLRPGASSAQFRALLAGIGGTPLDSLPVFGVYRVRLPRGADVPAAAAALRRNPWVAVAEPNYAYDLPPPSPLAGPGSAEIRPPAAARAGGAALAVFDTGLAEVQGFGPDDVAGAFDAVAPGRAMDDRLGHGTQMALIASGAVVPDGAATARQDDPIAVLAIRSFDDQGVTSNYSLMRGIEFAAEHGARVLSLSWGSPADSELLRHAIGYAQERDMIVVAAAGNEPSNQPVFPAAYPGVLGVSALLPDGSVWPQSNYGPFVAVSAPGTGVFPVGYEGPPGRYAGTSIATPYVARALALYFDRHPHRTPAAAVQALKAALTDAGDPGRDDYFGHGALTDEALQRLLGEPTPVARQP